MKSRAIAAMLSIALGLAAGPVSAQSIGLFWDPNGGTCSTTQGQNTGGTMYVLAILGGPSGGGITGAELRVDNFPSSWFASVNPNSPTALGNIMGSGGNIAFNTCQTGSGGVVLLYTVSYFAPDVQTNRVVKVERHSTPTNPNFQCPLHVLCDAPIYTKICATGGQGIINGGPCTVAAQQKSWSQVKTLYEN